MESPKFILKAFDERCEYHLPTSYKRFLRQTIFDNSKVELDEEMKDDLVAFVYKNTISSFIGWDENSILYTIALKTLAFNKKCLLVYFNNENATFELQPNSKATKVEWWNAIQFMEGDELCQSFGFQSPENFLTALNYYNKDLTTRHFYISELDYENISKFTRIYTSDVTNWFFIMCDEQNIQTIISTLSQKEEKPKMDFLLNLASSTVNIQIGGDEGYLDYVLIQSKEDISNVVKSIEKKQCDFIQQYESLLKDCKPFNEEWKLDFYKESYLELIKTYG